MAQRSKTSWPYRDRTQGLREKNELLTKCPTFHLSLRLDSIPNLLETTVSRRHEPSKARGTSLGPHFPLFPHADTLTTISYRGGRHRGPTGTRAQGLSLTARALHQLSYQVTGSTFDLCIKKLSILRVCVFCPIYKGSHQLWLPVSSPRRRSSSNLRKTI